MKDYIHNKTKIRVYDSGKFEIAEENCDFSGVFESERANFEINVSGGAQLLVDKDGFTFEKCEEKKNGITLYYISDAQKLYVTVKLEFIVDTNVVVQTTSVKNIGKEDIKLTRFSSAFIENIFASLDKPWYERDFLIHICNNKWQCEGQWQSFTPKQLGLIPATTHCWESESYKISSVGSWSTGSFYPMVMLEDRDSHKTVFLETEGSHNWFIKLCTYGGYARPSMSLEASGCDETNGGWFYDLHSGEEYFAERAFFGIISGGFEEACAELNTFKRYDSAVNYKSGVPYVVFNDYMDCIWGNQDPKCILPLIERAAEAGCEIFCIDGGWCKNMNGNGLGDWLPKDEYYSECTLKEISDKISKNNMIPGIWFEFEACNNTAYGYTMDEDCILKRYDKNIGESRAFYNFKNEKVRQYLIEKVREVYNIGFRFIKNDYNQSMGIGCTNNYDGDSHAEGLIQNSNAFYDFLNELYKEFPDLIIENCGSGALRSDNKMLRCAFLQSTSDQEFYYNNPSIIMGSFAQMPPEKAGIWAYPYPTTIDNHLGFALTDEYISEMSDGLQTAFNMITSMMGAMYLSGRIDLCDEYNFGLIKESVELYKKIRKFIPMSRPVYPTGMHSMNDKEFVSLGLLSEKLLLVAAWNINTGSGGDFCVDVSKYLTERAEIEEVYPKADTDKCTMDKKCLKLCLPSKNSGIFAVIKL